MHYLVIKFIINIVYILSILTICTETIDGRRNKYKEYVIEDYNLCSEITKRKIELKTNAQEGLIVTQKKTKLHHVADWSKNLLCKFSVQSDFGLYAVIQNLNFRKNLTSGECLDYVKFETKQNSYNVKLCGEFKVYDAIEPNLFNTQDSYGYIETTIFISREKWNEIKEMQLEIVYTLYKGCDNEYSPCQNPKQCINSAFVNDSVANCPVLCHDEGNCQLLKAKVCTDDCARIIDNSGASSTKIILSAVTSMVVAFLVFFVCIWICRKTGKLCFQENQESSTVPSQASRTIEMQTRGQEREMTSRPEVTAPEPEKDLPPSYDSLFPER